MEMERRLFVRFPMSGMVILQADMKDPATIDCELFDIGLEGAGLYSPHNLLVDRVKFIIINHQLGINLSGIARVVFSKPAKYNDKDYFRVGLEFLEVGRDQIRELLERVREIPPGQR